MSLLPNLVGQDLAFEIPNLGTEDTKKPVGLWTSCNSTVNLIEDNGPEGLIPEG